jgi:hypothetical protein
VAKDAGRKAQDPVGETKPKAEVTGSVGAAEHAEGAPIKKGPAAPGKPRVSQEAVLAFATARTALNAGRAKEALEGFRTYVALTSGASPERLEAQRQVIDLQRQFGEVEIVCDVQGATLIVDGRVAGTTPLRRSVILTPGPHALQVSKPGFRPANRQLSLRPGERQAVVFSLR